MISRNKKIVILGAGISGLSLGWFLRQQYGADISLTILEKTSRAGGWIQTVQQGGYLFEQGPHSCRTYGTGIATLELIESLGLEDEVIIADRAARRRYIYLDNKLTLLPSSLFSLISSSWLPSFFKAIIRDLKTPLSQNQNDESIFTFFERRFGRKITEQLVDPFVTGIYAGDFKQLSMTSCFPTLYNRGSLIRGWMQKPSSKKKSASRFVNRMLSQGLFTFKKGLGTLTDALEKRLSGSIQYNNGAVSLSVHSNQIDIMTEDGTHLSADQVFSTVSPDVIGHLLGPLHSDLSQLLKGIKSASVGVINLGYRHNVLPAKGFGYLVPSSEKQSILGAIWDSSAFPQQNGNPNETRLTVMMGGIHRPDLLQQGSDHCMSIALQSLHKHLGISKDPDTAAFHLAKQAIPQYTIGHAARLSAIESIRSSHFPNLYLLGSAFHGVSINDCIASALKVAIRV